MQITVVDLNSREPQKLGLTLFNDSIVRCIGRTLGREPIFKPIESRYFTKLCEELHFVAYSEVVIRRKLDNFALRRTKSMLGIPVHNHTS